MGAMDVAAFVMDDVHYIAVANQFNDATYELNSVIYRWNGTAFDHFQDIPTKGASDWEPFQIRGEQYLAVANNRDASGYIVDSVIYKWNGTAFGHFQDIPTVGARSWAYIEISGEPFLAVANFQSAATNYSDNSIVYSWLRDGSGFVPLQEIPTTGVIAITTMS